MNVVRRNVWAEGPCNVLVWAIEGRRNRFVIAELEQSEISIQFVGNCPDWMLSAEMVVCVYHDEVVQFLGWDTACATWRYKIISHHWYRHCC